MWRRPAASYSWNRASPRPSNSCGLTFAFSHKVAVEDRRRLHPLAFEPDIGVAVVGEDVGPHRVAQLGRRQVVLDVGIADPGRDAEETAAGDHRQRFLHAPAAAAPDQGTGAVFRPVDRDGVGANRGNRRGWRRTGSPPCRGRPRRRRRCARHSRAPPDRRNPYTRSAPERPTARHRRRAHRPAVPSRRPTILSRPRSPAVKVKET